MNLENPFIGMVVRCKTALITVVGFYSNGDVMGDAISPYPRKNPKKPLRLQITRQQWVDYIREGKIYEPK